MSVAESWLAAQRPSGMWTQLMDAASYEASSATGFGLHALATGLRLGVLRGARFREALASGWAALARNVQADGSVTALSPGFGILASKEDYLVRSNRSLLWGYGAVLRACAAALGLGTGD